MLVTIIVILVIIGVIGSLGELWKKLGKILGTCLVVGFIIGAIQEYPDFFITLGKIICVILVVLIALILLCWYRYHVIKNRFPTWIASQNIASLEESCGILFLLDGIVDMHTVWKPALESGIAFLLDSEHIICSAYHDETQKLLDQKRFFTAKEFNKLCRKNAPELTDDNLSAYEHYLMENNKMIAVETVSPNPPVYISSAVLEESFELFQAEGAATATEFSEVCFLLNPPKVLAENFVLLSYTLLKHQLTIGNVESVKLAEQDETLYVSKNPLPDGKMTQIVINLDE